MTRDEIIQKVKNKISDLEVEYHEIRKKLKYEQRKLFYLTDPTYFYPDRYYAKRIGRMRTWQKRIGKAFAEEYQIESMVDFGCGIGSFLEGALEGGAKKVRGFELVYDHAIKFAPEHMKKYLKYGNLGEPLDCGKWDCVISIEVAEHLLEEEADTYVDNIVNASNRLIILAASWGTDRFHFNPKQRDYWIGKFAVRGCNYSNKQNKELYELWDRVGGARYISQWDHLMIFTVDR